MQTRKRAKSVSFGKKHKEKPEKEEVKKIVDEEVVSTDSDKTSEKAAVVERRSVPEKPQIDELSSTPPKNEPEEASADVSTPANEFVTDSPLSATPEVSKETKEEEAAPADEALVAPAADGETLSQPVETQAQKPVAADPAAGDSQELSSTLPPSAFTIQSNEAAPAPTAPVTAPETGGKKRFGVYFLVVAFLSFILGLGAMAGSSYFGLVHGNLPKLPSNIQIPVIGQKPTPTVPPPTVAPTQKPVDLTTYTIEVLNGSGIAGKAADEKTSLTGAGFKVSSTGNADKSNFTKTEIAAKKSVNADFLAKLETELNKSYDVDTTVATNPDSSTADVTVTLGSQTSQ